MNFIQASNKNFYNNRYNAFYKNKLSIDLQKRFILKLLFINMFKSITENFKSYRVIKSVLSILKLKFIS